MTSATDTSSVEATLAQSEDLADMCEAFDPDGAPLLPAAEYWLMRAARQASATGASDLDHISALVGDARASGTSWSRIGELLGTSAAAAQEQYG